MELYSQTSHQLRELLVKRQIQSSDIIDSLKGRIDKIDKKIKAYVRIPETRDEGRGTRDDSILSGIPVAIKDNICVEGQESTCGSHILEGFKPPYNATVIEKLRNAGAITYGKTNMDEFAFGSSTETSYYGPTHNPWDLKRVPGGSSGGSAAAVASDEAIMALGSDTGGSIRQPASFCGVVGLKPTYGRVSRYGLIAFGSSLDQIGPITKDVSDAAILLNVIAGHDPMDSTSADIAVPDYTKSLVKDVKGRKIGIPKEYFIAGIDKEIKLAVDKAITLLKDLGATCKEVSLPHTQYAVAVYYIVATSEASSNLARFDGMQYGLRKEAQKSKDSLIDTYKLTRQYGFGQEAKRRIILGTYALSSGYYEAYYLRALKVRTRIKEDFDNIFKEYDCIITPTSPTVAFKAQERLDDPLTMYLSDIFTISANLAGIPGISLPCGFNKEDLPIGLQILGKPFDEETLFRVAYTYEQNTDWNLKRPKL